MSKGSDFVSVIDVLYLQSEPLNTFAKMWYHVFLWALFSSIFVHMNPFYFHLPVTFNKHLENVHKSYGYNKIHPLYPFAGVIAFLTLRKHKFGKFFPIAILLMGVVTPVATGIISSTAIAFVYRASSLPMKPLYAVFWGCGQTVVTACMGFTRILATL